MPDYCDNRAVIGHHDPEMLQRLVDAYCRCETAQEFLPIAEEFRYGDEWHDYRESQWGTPEDFGEGVCSAAPVHRDGEVELTFQTVKSPPLRLFITLQYLGFAIDAKYWEPGQGFCGYLCGSNFEEFEILCLKPACVRRHLDPALVRAFAIDNGQFCRAGVQCTHGNEPWSCSLGMDIDEYVAFLGIRQNIVKSETDRFLKSLRGDHSKN